MNLEEPLKDKKQLKKKTDGDHTFNMMARTCYYFATIKDQMTKILLFQCNCNILIVLPKRTILSKTA